MKGAMLLAALAWASEDRVSDEVTVWGHSEIQRAHQEVVNELVALGFDHKIIDKGDRLVLKHREPWRGKVVLYADGFTVHKRQGVRVQDPAGGSLGAAGWLLCPIQPTACVRAGGPTVAKRKLSRERTRTATAVEPKTRDLRDRIADASTTRTVELLPDRMEALWEHGEPLMGKEVLPDPAARRAHLIEFWATRTETEWGDQVREAVEAFAIAIIQQSEHPFTAEEIAAANQRSFRAFPVAVAGRVRGDEGVRE